MIQKIKKIRIFINEKIIEDKYLNLNYRQINYLFNVLRLGKGDIISIFDGKNGDFLSEIESLDKKKGKIKVIKKIKEVNNSPDLWLIFCPLKKKYTDFLIQKAVELGVRKIVPILTERTNNKTFRKERALLNMIEALEQCEGNFLPEIEDVVELNSFLKNYNTKRQLIFCNEKRIDSSIRLSMEKFGKNIGAILIGPEGGFTEKEIKMIKSTKSSLGISISLSKL